MSQYKPFTYLSITLFWALPAILVPGTYLSLTDIVTLSGTTWSIAKDQTTGGLFFGILPVEEVVFFFVTNILIVFGMTPLLSDIGRQRFKDWKSNHFQGLAEKYPV